MITQPTFKFVKSMKGYHVYSNAVNIGEVWKRRIYNYDYWRWTGAPKDVIGASTRNEAANELYLIANKLFTHKSLQPLDEQVNYLVKRYPNMTPAQVYAKVLAARLRDEFKDDPETEANATAYFLLTEFNLHAEARALNEVQ